MIDDLPYVQILDAPVPQVVDSAMDFFRRMDLPVAEQVIDVPMISSSSCSSRAVLREPQMAEQLVDVPIQHFVALLLQHPVDILVLLDRVRSASRSLTFLPQVVEFLAVFLVFPPRTVFHSAVFSCGTHF